MTARITVTGNVATAPITRQTSGGRTVTNFRVASTERKQDRDSGQWVDGNKFFIGVACWAALAENVAVSLRIGMPVVVIGKISQRTWSDENGQVKLSYEVQADSVSPDLSRGTAEFQRVSRSQGPSVATDADGNAEFGHSETSFDLTESHDVDRLAGSRFGRSDRTPEQDHGQDQEPGLDLDQERELVTAG